MPRDRVFKSLIKYGHDVEASFSFIVMALRSFRFLSHPYHHGRESMTSRTTLKVKIHTLSLFPFSHVT